MFWVMGWPSSASRVCSSNSSIAACPAPLAACTLGTLSKQGRAAKKARRIRMPTELPSQERHTELEPPGDHHQREAC